MNMTRHASIKGQQRGIPPIMIDLLLQFGKSESAGGGATKLFFDRQTRKQVAVYAGPLARMLDEHLDFYAVLGPDMQVITVGHRLERMKRN